ncbi:hypothetical protein ACFX1T_005565 [Malus domestica]
MSDANSDHHVDTPILDSESTHLLQSISEQGSYAYVRIESRAAARDLRAGEAAREMAWEQLHSDPWNSVLPVWRDAYYMACLHVAKLHVAAGEFRDALRALDMGLIMGGPLLKPDLHSLVSVVAAKARATRLRQQQQKCPNSDRRLVRQDVLSEELLVVLPRKSPSCKMVVKRSGLSLEGFSSEYLLPACPVILTDGMDHWPARSKWNDLDYLTKVAGDRTLPVEVGKNYLYPEWKQELITFSQFLERFRLMALLLLSQHILLSIHCLIR